MKLQIVFNGIKIIVLLAVLVSLGLFLWRGSISLTKGEAGESLKQLETSIRKATMLCYAAEGVYPPDLQYLKDHYGIQIDEDKYAVFYNCRLPVPETRSLRLRTGQRVPVQIHFLWYDLVLSISS